MYCCAHKTATLKPIQHTVPKGEQKKYYMKKFEQGVKDFKIVILFS